jgi:hypothetical protein
MLLKEAAILCDPKRAIGRAKSRYADAYFIESQKRRRRSIRIEFTQFFRRIVPPPGSLMEVNLYSSSSINLQVAHEDLPGATAMTQRFSFALCASESAARSAAMTSASSSEAAPGRNSICMNYSDTTGEEVEQKIV